MLSSYQPPAQIFRLCADTIIKPDGSIVVLEIGSFPESGFTGHDRHKPVLTKRQEAMRDLMAFAAVHKLPVFIVGDAELLLDANREIAKEEAGLFWNGDELPANFIDVSSGQERQRLVEIINALPAKPGDVDDLTAYKCIVVSLVHLQVGLKAAIRLAMFPMSNRDDLNDFRELGGVLFVDDKLSDVYQEIYNSKVVTSAFLPKEYMPKTLVLPRLYETDLAEKIMMHFAPAKKILIKPAHAARGHGILIINLDDQTSLDHYLRDLLLPEQVAIRAETALSQMNLNDNKYPEHYWLVNGCDREPTLVLQEFVQSATIEDQQKQYQSVTRFVFSCVYHKGSVDVIFHGNPYHKLACEPIDSPHIELASISRVHEESGPNPVIEHNQTLIASLEKQLTDCFSGFFMSALQYKSKNDVMQAFFASDNVGYQGYAMSSVLGVKPVSDADAENVRKLVTRVPAYRAAFFKIIDWQIKYHATGAPIEQVLAQQLGLDINATLSVVDLNAKTNRTYCGIIAKALASQFDELWQSASDADRVKLFAAFIHQPEFKWHYHLDDATTPEKSDELIEKLKSLLYSPDVNVALYAGLWAFNEVRAACCYMDGDENIDLYLQKSPLVMKINHLLKEYVDANCAFPVVVAYVKIWCIMMPLRHITDLNIQSEERDYLFALAIDYSATIINAYQQGIGCDFTMRETSLMLHIYTPMYCALRDNFPSSGVLNEHQLKIYLIVQWIRLEKYYEMCTTSDEIARWTQYCVPFSYLWKDFSLPQQVINAAWSLALNTIITNTNPDIDLGLTRAVDYIINFLVRRLNLMPTDPHRNIDNYTRIESYLSRHKDEEPLGEILGHLHNAVKQQVAVSIAPHATQFGSVQAKSAALDNVTNKMHM